ncbi:hypothetical protein Ahy_A04g019476 isoform B [Arachis hypogaea]|nr:hypothetical protein Ahy_A04g019476 isoform B [Arachis hypogaea]
MVNQLLAGVHIASAAEAMAFGARLGLNTRLLFNFITISGGTSWNISVYETLTGVRVEGKLQVLRKDIVLHSLPPEWPQDPLLDIQKLTEKSSKILVVLRKGGKEDQIESATRAVVRRTLRWPVVINLKLFTCFDNQAFMLDSEYEAHVLDFGTAKFFKPGSHSWTIFAGTFGYATPAIKKRMEKDIDEVGKIAHGVKTKIEAINRYTVNASESSSPWGNGWRIYGGRIRRCGCYGVAPSSRGVVEVPMSAAATRVMALYTFPMRHCGSCRHPPSAAVVLLLLILLFFFSFSGCGCLFY